MSNANKLTVTISAAPGAGKSTLASIIIGALAKENITTKHITLFDEEHPTCDLALRIKALIDKNTQVTIIETQTPRPPKSRPAS